MQIFQEKTIINVLIQKLQKIYKIYSTFYTTQFVLPESTITKFKISIINNSVLLVESLIIEINVF